MNERMIELYKEACEFAYDVCAKEGRKGGTSDHIWNTLSTGKFAELIVQDYAKKTIQGLMSDPAFVQAMDEYYEQKWAHRFD